MRVWRVGTISMGIALIYLGVFLILSQLFNWKPAYALISWWPIILVILGLEILMYIFLSKQDHPVIKYDIFSILMIGLIGLTGIGFAAINTTGILDKVYDWTNFEIKTVDLPTYSVELDNEIKRIVVHTGLESITIDSGITKDFTVFGTYEGKVVDEKATIMETKDYLSTEQRGDTLYVMFKSTPKQFYPFDYYNNERFVTMIIPDDVQLEIDANYKEVLVNTRTFLNDWTIMNAREVNVHLGSNLDMTVNVENVEDIQNQNDEWEIDEKQKGITGTLEYGKGTHMLNILNSNTVSVVTR